MLGHRALSPQDYLAILKKRWWILLLPALILPILTYAASYLVPPQFLSQTLVLVEQQKVPDEYVKPVIEEDITGRLASMKEQILSRSRLQPILERFNLYAGQRMNMDDRIEKMRKDIDIKPIRSEMAHGVPGFFISFKAGDARTAQAVCEEITSMFVNQNLADRAAQTAGTTAFLQNQLTEAKRQLDEQDAKLAKFQQEYAGRLPDDVNSNNNMLNSLSGQLSSSSDNLNRLQQERVLLETMLAQQVRTNVVSASGGPRSSPVEQNTELQSLLAQEADLSSRYTADYPDLIAVRRKIKDLRHQIAQSAAAPAPSSNTATQAPDTPDITRLRLQIKGLDLSIAQQRREQTDLGGQLSSVRARLSASPLVQEQYKDLTRDYQITQARYNDLLKKMNDSQMARDLENRQQGEQFRVMDAANLPDSPNFPKRPIFALGGLGLGLALGLGIIALVEYRDTALRSEKDVWTFTRLPTLATISVIREAEPRRGLRHIPTDTPRRRFLRKKKQPQTPTSPLTTVGS